MDDTASNIGEYSVSELSFALKRTVEDAFGFVRVRGEISGYRGPHASGHAYFAIKDEGAKIDAVVWRGVFSRLRFKPEEGMEVIASGKITTYPGKSSYQIVIDQLEPAGVGALMALLEERKRKLTAEGLFDPARKQLLPVMPRVVGVVTSPTGAVIRDILHRIADRFPVRVVVWPVRVQGETSAAEVAAAIRGFNALEADGAIPRPDVIVVARGGGSLEDLWGFNEEAVVRAAADSAIPLVSAVGHETDTTLIDFAADVRAPTPTAAAEMVVPVRADLLDAVEDRGRRLGRAVRRTVEQRRREFSGLARALPRLDDLLALPRQRFDQAARRLPGTLERAVARRRSGFDTLKGRLTPLSVTRGLALRRERIATLDGRAARAIAVVLERRSVRLAGAGKLLDTLSYRSVLRRGFALVRGADGRALRSADLPPGTRLDVEFADGRVAATTDGAPAPKSKPGRLPKPREPDLFG